MTPQEAYRKLTAAARAGNPHARQALRGLMAQLATPTVVGRTVDEELAERAGDDLEMADLVAQESDFAGDDLARKAATRNARLGAINQQAQFVSTNPPGVLAGISGNQATVAPGELIQVANAQVDDAHTTTLSIVIAPVQPLVTADSDAVSGYPTNFEARPYARVRFGNKAFATAALVDIGGGVQFDVSGSMVTIEVGLHAIPASAVSGVMQLAGMVSSYKSIMRTAPLYYTLYVDDTSVLSQFKVPPFARSVTFLKFDASKHVTLRALAPSPVTNNKYDIDLPANSQQTVPLPLTGDIQLLQAFDNATVQNAAGRLIFELGL